MTGKLTSLFSFLLFICIASCSKKTSNPPTPPPQDSLGAGWQKVIVDTFTHFGDVYFPDNTTGYVAGYKTGQIVEIHFNDIHHGWAADSHGYIFRYNQ